VPKSQTQQNAEWSHLVHSAQANLEATDRLIRFMQAALRDAQAIDELTTISKSIAAIRLTLAEYFIPF